MANALLLLLPGLVPSWAFFQSVQPSPRVQWRVMGNPGADDGTWTEFRPRPKTLTFRTRLWRLIWNPVWNENLYLVSLAERLMDTPADHSEAEIYRRLAAELLRAGHGPKDHVQFRLVFLHRRGGDIVDDVTYVAAPRPLGDALL